MKNILKLLNLQNSTFNFENLNDKFLFKNISYFNVGIPEYSEKFL